MCVCVFGRASPCFDCADSWVIKFIDSHRWFFSVQFESNFVISLTLLAFSLVSMSENVGFTTVDPFNNSAYSDNYFSLSLPLSKSFARHLHEIQRCLCDIATQHSSTMSLVLTPSHHQPESLDTTAQTGPILFHLVKGHSTMARVKVMSWRPPASCIWMAQAPSVLLQNANAQV